MARPSLSITVQAPGADFNRINRKPYVKAAIMTPKEYIGPIMELCQEKRGIYVDLEYLMKRV
jgi:translation elongation factor EF-4